MDVTKNTKHWFSSRSQRAQNIRLGRSYTRPHHTTYSPISYDGKKTLWQMVWRKLKREKRRVFNSPDSVDGVYDLETYSMNFDHGNGWMEPDNLPRSFSARYADPSRILPPSSRHLLSFEA